MTKRKINQFHDKYPFAESIFLFVIGILVGIFSNILTGEILSNYDESWRIVDSWNFRATIFLMIIGVIYYWKLSSYSIGKQIKSSQLAADTLIETLVNETKKMLESDTPITHEKKLTLVKKTAQTIQEVGDKLSGGTS